MGIIDHKLDLAAVNPIFETLITCISDGVLITNEDGEVLCQNEASRQMLGEDNHDAPGERELDRIFDLAKRSTCAAFSYASNGSPLDNFVRVKEQFQSGGATRDLELFLGTITLPEGDRRLNVVISQDRTQPKGPEGAPELKKQGFITNDREMLSIISRLEQIADSTAPVLLMGESGTGKTQVARMIHERSSRANKPLIEVNCAAIPEQLLESELFGHVKGAFTGATQKRKGRFQAAHGSTLLLDEIGEIPLHLQAKLLRAIQDQRFEPVGSDETIEVDVRVISATNQNLRDMVNEGKFRADLFYRLAVVPIKIPPLRERVGDIPLLLKHFCTDLTARGYPNDVACTPDAMRMMMDYPWPGNVREMINAVEHAYICAIDKAVVPESLPQDIRHHAISGSYVNLGEISPRLNRRQSDRNQFGTAYTGETNALHSATNGDADQIRQALQAAGGNKSAAAKALGIDRTTLWRRMRKFGLA
ncbi:sigma-54 interaction domain-containing protein [Magnetovibrio sp.]|uniref:sigma-54 interaction domain-containing protein n=1 Tax=Magnetovibrio sp. TaxID=2024836 RepID=UPI002F93C940